MAPVEGAHYEGPSEGKMLLEADLIRLGEGGLCQKCKPCRFPNCSFGRF